MSGVFILTQLLIYDKAEPLKAVFVSRGKTGGGTKRLCEGVFDRGSIHPMSAEFTLIY